MLFAIRHTGEGQDPCQSFSANSELWPRPRIESGAGSAPGRRLAMTRAKIPTLRFLFAHPAHFLALGFGAGLAPVAPGTFGTLVALPLAALLRAYAPDAVYLIVVVIA